MTLRWLFLLSLALLAACRGGDMIRGRALEFSAGTAGVVLAPSQTRQLRVTLCPAIRTGRYQAWDFVAYQPGRYTLGTARLPPGVSARFVDGDSFDIPAPVEDEANGTWSKQEPYPSAYETSDTRFCWERTLEITRDATRGAGQAPEAVITLHVLLENAFPLDQLELDHTYTAALPILLTDETAGAPPVTGVSCPAGQPLAGRWQDFAPAPGFDGASHLFDFALVQDRPLVARGRITFDVRVDEWIGTAWSGETLTGRGAIDAVRLAVWRDPSTGVPRRFVAWLATDFNRPLAGQTVLQLAERGGGGAWSPIATPEADLQGNFRSLQLVAWRGDAVAAWLRPDGVALRSGRPGDGFGLLLPLPVPVDAPFTGTTRELRLAVDPVDDALVLVLAQLDADGVTRLRAWRLVAPGAEWQALPPLDAGPAGGFTAGLASLAVTAQAGEVTLGWAFGEAAFSSNARMALTVMRHRGGAWQPLGDPATLPDATRRYALQPLGLALAPTCSGGVFMAWNEPQLYPQGAVFAAQYAAQGGWDPLGRNPLAMLPDGTGSYASAVELASGSDGRPVAAALMSLPGGGNPLLVVRRFGP
jgi:hypothetical protein